MNITIKINTENSAFSEFPTLEIERIFNEQIKPNLFSILANENEFFLRDINGNTVGKIEVNEWTGIM